MSTAHRGGDAGIAAAAPSSGHSRLWFWWALGLALLLIAALVAATMIEEPLRRRMERELNRRMIGYTVAVPILDLHPFSFSLTLRDPTVHQQAHPDPPVITIDALHAGVHWRALLSLRLVADFTFEAPRVHIDRTQLVAERSDRVDVEDKGWQDALQSIYPLKINRFVVRDGTLTYVDDERPRPLEITHLNLVATNIRNIADAGDAYPSQVQLSAAVFEFGRLRAEGAANFLAKPHPAMRAAIEVTKLPLERLRPVAADANVHISGGTLSAQGEVEYAAEHQRAHLRRASLDGVVVDYIHSPETAVAEARRIERLGEVASELSDKPTALIAIDHVDVSSATLGFVDETADPHYRLFVSDAVIELRDLSNQPEAGRGRIHVKGKFMGSGTSSLRASFLPRRNNPDLELAIQIEDTRLQAMNDLFRARGDFDVADGSFSFFSELRIVDRKITGYVKPLFKNLDVYERRQDRADSAAQQIYEALVGGVAVLLENPSDQVATKATVSGQTTAPDLSTWEVIVNLIRNAFFKAILPGLDSAARAKPADAPSQ